jgi:hypothetical protein
MDVRGNRLCPGSASVTAAGRSLDTKKRIDKRLLGCALATPRKRVCCVRRESSSGVPTWCYCLWRCACLDVHAPAGEGRAGRCTRKLVHAWTLFWKSRSSSADSTSAYWCVCVCVCDDVLAALAGETIHAWNPQLLFRGFFIDKTFPLGSVLRLYALPFLLFVCFVFFSAR